MVYIELYDAEHKQRITQSNAYKITEGSAQKNGINITTLAGRKIKNHETYSER